MTAEIIDGNAIAAQVLAELGPRVEALRSRGVQPGLAFVLVGENPAPQAPTWVFKREQLRRAHDEVVRLVGEMNPEHTEMRRSRKCDWCDFRSICTAEITGADIEGVKQELFTVRPTEQERMEKEYDTGI
ncbi:MAG: PD-(D/E)XK nuclease family protein [Chloroflexi bacterium]|nr:PD-(D/E)XK nuclease family protein [Chloroflexota bacterium]